MIYAFFKNDNTSPLEVLEELNFNAKKLGLCEFYMKKIVISDESQVDYEDRNCNYKIIF